MSELAGRAGSVVAIDPQDGRGQGDVLEPDLRRQRSEGAVRERLGVSVNDATQGGYPPARRSRS